MTGQLGRSTAEKPIDVRSVSSGREKGRSKTSEMRMPIDVNQNVRLGD